MDNFHYKNLANNAKTDKSNKLLQQLQMIDKQLQQDHRKLAERKKLQEQFYEDSSIPKNKPVDKNMMNMADQIMNQLLNPKIQSKPQQNNKKLVFNQYEGFPNLVSRQAPSYQDQNINYNPVPAPQVPRNYMQNAVEPAQKNQFVNQRELQKLKLQNKNAQQQFPFGNNSRQKQRRRISPEREPPMKDNFMGQKNKNKNKQKQQQSINPFLKDQPLMKQKREEQQRQYRILLEQQMREERRRKQQQKQRIKQEQRQKYNNIPISAPTMATAQSPTDDSKPNQLMSRPKKRDPNAQHVPLEKPSSDIRPSDLEYMRVQVVDLRNRFKKGRINHQEYESQIKKIQNHYKIKADQLLEEENAFKNQPKIRNQTERPNNDQPIKNNSQRLKGNANNPIPNQEIFNKQTQNYPNRNPSNLNVNQLQHYPNVSLPIESQNASPNPNFRQNMAGNFSNYYPQQAPQVPISAGNPSQQSNDYQMQMMFKLLDEFKNIFKMQSQSHLNDKKVLQQTLTKMIPNMNSNLATQQIPASQLPHLPKQKQYHTDKKLQRIDNFPKVAAIPPGQISYPHSSESEISSSYVEKSMSGIVQKIPLSKKQKEDDKNQSNKDIIKFYERKYRIKKFKGFEYTESDNQSNILIPSVSNFLQTKNSQIQLSAAFQRDLRNYKKMEKERDLQLMKQKLKKTNEGSNRQRKTQAKKIDEQFSHQTSNFYKHEPIKKTQSLQNDQPNPFLKKHISNQSQPNAYQNNSGQTNKSFKYNSYQHYQSPSIKSAEILQQQEYQTEPRKAQSPKKVKNENENNKKFKKKTFEPQTYHAKIEIESAGNVAKQYPSSKILNIMKTNNEILAKYQMSPAQNYNENKNSSASRSNSQVGQSISTIKESSHRGDSSKDLSSREYFSGHEISPVQRREYQSSMETVRSQEQSAKVQRRNNMELLMMGSAERSSYTSNYQSPIPQQHQIHASPPTIQSIEVDRQIQVSANNPSSYQQADNRNMQNMNYSQTVESIQQSSSKLPSFQRPPNNSKKNGRSVSKKKQSVIKLNNSSQSIQKSILSGIPSQGSKQKSSSLLKPPQVEDNISNMPSPRFDSAVYESNYEQTIDPKYKLPSMKQNQGKSIPTTFKQVLEKGPSIEQSKKSQNKDINMIRQTRGQLQKQSSQLKQQTVAAPRLRSLQQARKLAKQYRLKSHQQHNRSSVQQKLSQLQSFIQHTNQSMRKQEHKWQFQDQREQSGSKIIYPQAKTTKKKDISKILDGLVEDEYQPDFDSYKQQSQN